MTDERDGPAREERLCRFCLGDLTDEPEKEVVEWGDTQAHRHCLAAEQEYAEYREGESE